VRVIIYNDGLDGVIPPLPLSETSHGDFYLHAVAETIPKYRRSIIQ
jgi:hypothetical protein